MPGGSPHTSNLGMAEPSSSRMLSSGNVDTGGSSALTPTSIPSLKTQVHIVEKEVGEGQGAALGDTVWIFYILYVNKQEIDKQVKEPISICLGSKTTLEGECHRLTCQG